MHAIMGLHCRKFWEGESGLGNGFPIAIAISAAPNTGKTWAMTVAK